MKPAFYPTKFFATALLLLAGMGSTFSQSLQPRNHWWHTNGEVVGMTYNEDDDLLYISGQFTHVGPVAPFGVGINDSGEPNLDFAKPNGRVRVAVPDDNGGWFIGGDFTEVGGQPRARIAHLDSNGQPTAWNPGANAPVYTLLKDGNALYVGGDFTQIGGQFRNRLAQLDATTGAPDAWNPDVNNIVRCAIISGGFLYVGGDFSLISSQIRQNIARFDANTGMLDSWNSACNGAIHSIAAVTSGIITGGAFTNIGGQPRNRIASLSTTTGLATAWNPNASATVNAVAISGGVIYIGGEFTTVSGVGRNRLAALPEGVNTPTAWNPDASNAVRTLLVHGSNLLVGGTFGSLAGQEISCLASVDLATGSVGSWIPRAGAEVNVIATDGTSLYAGGNFHSAGGVNRRYLAAIDVATGEATGWNPGANLFATVVDYHAGTLYVGGSFTQIAGQPRNRLAAFNTSNGDLLAWNPNSNNTITSLLATDDVVYAGGNFNNIGGEDISFLAAIDALTGLATSWNPQANSTVSAMQLSGTTLYCGGSFTGLGGAARNFLGAVNTTSGLATTFNPGGVGANQVVSSLALNGSTLYVGGAFSALGGQPRNFLGAVTTGGAVTAWNPGPNQAIFDLASSGDLVFAVGDFTTFTSSFNRNGAAALSTTPPGFATGWDPNLNGTGTSVVILPDGVVVGGPFTSTYDGFSGSRSRLAAFDWQCIEPDVPTLSASDNDVCGGTQIQLSITSGSLNDALNWEWTADDCGQGPVLSQIIFATVSPEVTTTYYARGVGPCFTPGDCAEITINVTPNSTNTIDIFTCGEYVAPDGAVYDTEGTYTAILPNAAGCDSTITINLSLNPALTTGNLDVTALVGGVPFEGIKVELFSLNTSTLELLPVFEEEEDIPLTNAQGKVLFEDQPAGLYRCRVKPTPSQPGQQSLMSTYSNGVFSWAQSEEIMLQCDSTKVREVNVIQLPPFGGGPGLINGQVLYLFPPGMPVVDGMPRSLLAGDPIPGIPVILGDTASLAGSLSGGVPGPGFNILSITLSDANGFYTFDDLPIGNYSIIIEKPDLPMAEFHEITIGEDSFEHYQKDFYVDEEVAVFITDVHEEIGSKSARMAVYPNPFQDEFYLTSEKRFRGVVDYEIRTGDGRLVESGTRNEQGFMLRFSPTELARGVYFLNVRTGGENTTLKLVKY
jgi:trimeric autotransporter adhesin